jgi:CheY-like chemotaxis protein
LDGLMLPDDQLALLYQSVRELLINVVKHAETARASILVAQDAAGLRIEVRDDGKGFDSSTADARDRVTFGLLSIDERMKALGGSFDLRSTPEQGTTATLVLPLKSTEEAPSVVPPINEKTPAVGLAPAHPTDHQSSCLRVLLVDDHAMMRQGLQSVLDSYADVEVVGVAGDGEEALALADKLRPTVVVMDINMPKMNGIEATRAIKSRYPEMKVIGLSVNSGSENSEAMKEAGAALLITKEAAVEQLYAAIKATPPL